jgi:hypothetical protein
LSTNTKTQMKKKKKKKKTPHFILLPLCIFRRKLVSLTNNESWFPWRDEEGDQTKEKKKKKKRKRNANHLLFTFVHNFYSVWQQG